MNGIAKIFVLLVGGMMTISSCTDNNSGAFDNILSNPPFQPLTDSIEKSPENDDLYFRRAVLLNTNNLPEPALADFKKAWSLNKKEQYAFGISNILLEKKPDSAALFLLDATKELPQSLLLRLSLARAYDAQNKTDEALKVADEILQINPQQVDVLVLKSDLLHKKNDLNGAITLLERAYELTPFDVELNYNLAYKYAESKNPKVIALTDSLAKMDSLGVHGEPYYYKGIYFSNVGDKAKAISLFDEAIKHDYYFKNAYIEKGRVLFEQKKYEQAYAVFNLVMSISPSFADAYYWMGRCQEATGNTAEAKLNYQRAYGLDKTFTEAKEAADKIK